ncbi:hypothetical protein ACIRD6_36140 [Streptomyces sp. NPDC102473]|uniref:hypothetical protein n=1 Tax=Streptomyces sp. NPDC102473 TaxID=3366180 RepID=UPI003804B17A
MQAEHDQFAQLLPWSAEPMAGWKSDKQLHSDYLSEKEDSPGYTPEQAERLAGCRARILERSDVLAPRREGRRHWRACWAVAIPGERGH